MPRYDVRCEVHGVREIFATLGHARSRSLRCPDCGHPAEQVFSTPPFSRVDAAADIRRDDPDPRSRGLNVGLGVPASVASSNHKCREIARERGLTPLDGGSYRPTPR